jgi:hypothetical protein
MLVAPGARQGVKRALRRSVEGGLWRSCRRSEARHEQGLVDAALEDRDAQLHALRDDVPSLESGLAGELSGRQVNGHRSCVPPACLHRPERIARVSDNLNLMCLKGRSPQTNGQVSGPWIGVGTSMKTWRMPTLGEPLARRPHAEGLGRVAAGGEEVDLRSRARVTSRAIADDRARVGRERLHLGGADGLGEERVVADLEVAVERGGVSGPARFRVPAVRWARSRRAEWDPDARPGSRRSDCRLPSAPSSLQLSHVQMNAIVRRTAR